MVRIDLNCDMGESFGVYTIGRDEELLKVISSANIACGFHAGDPATMRRTVRLALENNVSIGAHPGFPDLAGFGRRKMDISPIETYDLVLYQIGALEAMVRAEGGTMSHVKPHGALYNMAAKNASQAKAIAEAVYHFNPGLVLYGLAGSELIMQGNKAGLQTAGEVFADRTYQEDGSLTPRDREDALIQTSEQALAQVMDMVTGGYVTTQTGTNHAIHAQTICIHGDSLHATLFAKTIRSGLEAADIEVGSMTL